MAKKMMKIDDRYEHVNWCMKKTGYEIISCRGANGHSYYPAQLSKGLRYIEDNFDKTIATLNSWDIKEDTPIEMGITGAIVFKIKKLNANEVKNALKASEPQVKEAASPIGFLSISYEEEQEILGNDYDKLYRAFSYKAESKRVCDVRRHKDGHMEVRYGQYCGYDDEKYVHIIKWDDNAWMTPDNAVKFSTDNNWRADEVKIKKWLRTVEEFN